MTWFEYYPITNTLSTKLDTIMATVRLFFILVIVVYGSPVQSQVCPYGWLLRPNSNTCYSFTKNSATNNWEDSRLKCTAAGGDLASIRSADEWSFINQTMYMLYMTNQKSFRHWWIGLNRRDDGSTWKWPDGSTADTSILTWRKNATFTNTNKNCVYMYLFEGMGVATCSLAHYQALCSRPLGLPILCDADNGWQRYNGKCYKYFDTQRTWDSASQTCQTFGATLPIIPDLTTQTIVADFARQKKTNLWTGLRSSGQPNKLLWVWPDGSKVTGGQYWIPNQPAPNVISQNNTCVELNTNSHLPSTWVASPCNSIRKFYCQRPQGKCADGWLEYGSMCYQFNSHFSLPWPKASSYCQGQGGNLVAITSSNIQTFLNQYLTTQNQVGVTGLWTGLTDNNHDGGPWTFTSGTSLGSSNYTNWNSNPPTNHHGSQDCVYIATSDINGKWHVAGSCSEVRSFICQINTNTQVKPVTQPPNHYICPTNWVNNDKYCYYFNEEDKSFDDARSWCKGNGSDLVRISDAGVQGFLASKIQNQGDYWIGLNDRHQEGWWMWLDDTTNATYTYWFTGEPNNGYGGVENCASMIAETNPSRKGRWHDNKCSNKFNFICQVQAQNAYNTPPPTTPTPWSTKCGPFWTSDPFTPFCYQFSDEKLTWFDARSTCQSRGGDLASVETSEESAYLTGRIRQMHSADFWIGANDQGTEGGWRWIDGRPFAFINWQAGEPNDFNQGEDCGAVYGQNGRWDDQYCNGRKGFICKSAAYYVCDSGWKEFKHNCFNFNINKNSWQDSRKWCINQGSDLVRIMGLDTLGFVRDQLIGTSDWWTGLNDRNKTGVFVWLDDNNPSGIVQWKSGSGSAPGTGDCVALLMTQGALNEGKYYRYSCTQQNSFVCMKPARQVSATVMPQTTTPNSVPAGSVYGCPLNWRGFRGSCYYFAWDTGSYDSSIRQCGWMGSKLASITDDAENKFVFSMIPKSLSQPGKAIWIGLNDRSIEMKYVWLDGERVTYTNWHKDEPNNWQGHDEDCVAMYTQDGMWNDRICTEEVAGTVCKTPKSIIPNSQLEIGKGCQGGQIGYHTTCYEFSWSPTKSWSDAEKVCVSRKGHLATIPDRHVQAFLGAEMLNKGSTWWVGLSDMQTPGQYKWSSGQPFSFSAWHESHTGNERSTCVGIRSGHPAGLWENRNCTDHRSYICEYPRTGYTTPPTTPTTTPSPLPCPNSWTAFGGNCYKYFGDSPDNLQTWTGARATCRGFGGDLVSISSSGIEMFFKNKLLASKRVSVWIGLNDRDAENAFEWTDGTPFGYSHWSHGEPNNWNHKEDCVQYNSLSSTWNDDYCYGSHYFMCQLKKGIQITTTPTHTVPSTSPLCVGNGTWYFYNNNCYMVSPVSGSDSQKSWYNAIRYCNKQGGDLASIHSPDDSAFVASILKALHRHFFWIGLNNIDMSGYRWSDGTPVEFSTWDSHQPDDGEGEKRCVKLASNSGTWLDDNCNNLFRFVCQKLPLNTKPIKPYPSPITGGSCPPGYTTFFATNRCYMVGGTTPDKALNWTAANAMCKKQTPGANLAVILDDLENNFVITLLNGLKTHAWIGLMDRQTNGLYMWVDSSEVRYTGWGPGQPDEDVPKDRSEHRTDCVKMWTDPRGRYQAGGWDDYFCDYKLAYVCSAPEIQHGYVTPNTAACLTGYDRYGHSCYKGYRNHLTWKDAQAACARDGNGGNLASLNGAYEAAFVRLTMIHEKQGPSWIGLSDYNTPGNFSWSDGYPMLYSYWGVGQPIVVPGGGCVFQKWNFKWNITSCTDKKPYMCEIHVAGGPTALPPITGSCPDSTWTAGPSYCYKATTLFKSWPESRYMCQKQGAELVSVESQTEMALITNLLTNITTDIWIGLSKTADNGYKWSDRSPVDFLNWGQNEPSDRDRKWQQDCVLMMKVSSWQWNDVDCFTKSGYVCKILKRSNSSTTTLPVTQPIPRAQNTPVNPVHSTKNLPSITNPMGTFGTPFHPSFTQKGTSGPIHTLPLIHNPVSSPGGGLTGGAIAGILIGVIAVLLVAGIVVVLVRRKYPGVLGSPSDGFTNALYNRHNEEVSVSPKNEDDC